MRRCPTACCLWTAALRSTTPHRPTAKGTGSYDLIVPKFKKLVEGRGDKDYYLRGYLYQDNLDFAEDVMHIASLGFESVSVEPAVGKPDDPFAIREEDVPQVCEGMTGWPTICWTIRR